FRDEEGRQEALEGVEEQRCDRGRPARRAGDVGRADVPGPDGAHVLASGELCQEKAERDRAHEVRSSDGEREDHRATRAATKHQFATIATAIAMRAKRAPDGPRRGTARGMPQRRTAVARAKAHAPIATRLP